MLESFRRSIWDISIKFCENFKKKKLKTKKKILNDSRQIIKTLSGKTAIIWNWCYWYYEEILDGFSKIILVKLEKKLRRHPLKNLNK